MRLQKVKEVVVHWVTYHPWIKIISLILAIVLWYYVRGELMQVP